MPYLNITGRDITDLEEFGENLKESNQNIHTKTGKPKAKKKKQEPKPPAYASIHRGDIRFVRESAGLLGSEQAGGRPAVIVSNNKGNRFSPVVEVVYLTTQKKTGLPTHVEITSSPKPSTAICEQVSTVSKERKGEFIGHATAEEMARIGKALKISLGLD